MHNKSKCSSDLDLIGLCGSPFSVLCVMMMMWCWHASVSVCECVRIDEEECYALSGTSNTPHFQPHHCNNRMIIIVSQEKKSRRNWRWEENSFLRYAGGHYRIYNYVLAILLESTSTSMLGGVIARWSRRRRNFETYRESATRKLVGNCATYFVGAS